ncbi:MAG: RNA ligase family protein [Eubacteriales bacterium]
MIKYPKIETLYNRNKETHFVTDEVRCPEFENINKWLVTEKIDGMNIRICYESLGVDRISGSIRGRTDNAQLPGKLFDFLKEKFTLDTFKVIIGDKPKPDKMILFGEGYGAKIQKGGGDYCSGNSFRLFDVWIDGYWLEWDSVEHIADLIGIKTAPVIMETTVENAVDLITRIKNSSEVALIENRTWKQIEGIVARAYPMVLFRNGNPVKWKLKYSDYNRSNK